MKEEETKQGPTSLGRDNRWVYLGLVLLTSLFIVIGVTKKYFTFKQAGVVLAILIAIFLIGFFYFKWRENKTLVISAPEQIENQKGWEIIADILKYSGITSDISKLETSEMGSELAQEPGGKFDRKVIFVHIDDTETRDEYWVFMEGEKNQNYKEIERMRYKDYWYVEALKKVNIRLIKNVPDQWLQENYAKIINSFASKSNISFIQTYDENGKLKEERQIFGYFQKSNELEQQKQREVD